MSWAKLDDGFLLEPVVMAMGLEARALFVAGLLHCGKGLTDGHIVEAAVPKLGVMADIPDLQKSIAVLVDLGAWRRAAGGYFVADWHTYLQSRVEVEEARAKKAAAGQAGGRASAKARAGANAGAGATANGAANEQHYPGPSRPVPVPSLPFPR